MRQSKLFELLRSFTAVQWRRFGDFVRSPYFNQREDICTLYNLLSAYHPGLDHPDLDKSAVIRNWPIRPQPDEKDITYLMSRLIVLAEQFLAVESLQKDSLEVEIRTLNALQKAGLKKHFSGNLEKVRKLLEQEPLRDVNYYKHLFEVSKLEYYTTSDPFKHQYNPVLSAVSEQLDRYYLLQKLRLLSDMTIQEKYRESNPETFFEQTLKTAIPGVAFIKEPAFEIYFLAWEINTTDDIGKFEAFYDLLLKHGKLLPESEQKALFAHALNFCIRRINKYNDNGFYQTYLNISERLLSDNLLFENGVFPPWRFMNMVNAGIKTRQWDRMQQFIEKWSKNLPADYAENLSGYCTALLYYSQGKYSPAQKAMARVEFQDAIFSLAARALLIKIYFESGETELLFSALEAARIYLLRADRIDPGLRKQMQHFIDFTRRMAKIYPPEPLKFQKLIDALPPAAALMHRDWLLEQLNKK